MPRATWLPAAVYAVVHHRLHVGIGMGQQCSRGVVIRHAFVSDCGVGNNNGSGRQVSGETARRSDADEVGTPQSDECFEECCRSWCADIGHRDQDLLAIDVELIDRVDDGFEGEAVTFDQFLIVLELGECIAHPGEDTTMRKPVDLGVQRMWLDDRGGAGIEVQDWRLFIGHRMTLVLWPWSPLAYAPGGTAGRFAKKATNVLLRCE